MVTKTLIPHGGSYIGGRSHNVFGYIHSIRQDTFSARQKSTVYHTVVLIVLHFVPVLKVLLFSVGGCFYRGPEA